MVLGVMSSDRSVAAAGVTSRLASARCSLPSWTVLTVMVWLPVSVAISESSVVVMASRSEVRVHSRPPMKPLLRQFGRPVHGLPSDRSGGTGGGSGRSPRMLT